MNKTRKIVALIGVISLFLLYASTLYFALFDSSDGMVYFKTAVLGTIFFPIVLYAMNLYHKLGQKRNDDKKNEN